MFCTCTVQLAHKEKPNKVLISHKRNKLNIEINNVFARQTFCDISVYADNSSNIEIKF